MNEKIMINNDWNFTENFSEEIIKTDYKDSSMSKVRIPHNVKEMPFHYFDEHIYQMVSGYRKTIKTDKNWKGKKVILCFDGVAHDCEVYVNAKKVKEHHCGYTGFKVDITDYLNDAGSKDDNVIAVKVDSNENVNIPPFGFVIDYLTYGGIYRDVYLEIKEDNYFKDVFISSLISGKNLIETDSFMLAEKARIIMESSTITKEDGLKVKVSVKTRDEEYRQIGESIYSTRMEFDLADVKLWDTENPWLYDVKISLYRNENVIDEKIIRHGFRKAVFHKDGFYLNGKRKQLRGLNRHQSFPYVGYAMPASMQEYDAKILKEELGVNVVRTSHYPQSHYFLNKCDEIGLLVVTEIPGWQHIGDNEWKQQAIQNVEDMIIQYRNHPSIILWGVRINESSDDDDFYRRTNLVAKALDNTRQTCGVRCFEKSNLFEDVYTFNDFVHDGKKPGCKKKNKVTSDVEKPYLITEYNGHMFPTKSYDCEDKRLEHALRHATVLNDVTAETDIAGCIGWCMFDYNTHKDFGSGDRICYHGVLDYFRNPKIATYVYASQQEKKPFLEVSTTMDIGEHPGGNCKDTYLFTNADSVLMYKNNELIKEYFLKDSPFKYLSHGPIRIDDYAGSWGDATKAYRFEAVKDGEVVKTLTIEPMKSVGLDVTASHTVLTEGDTYDVALVRIKAVDENGNQLYFANEPVKLEVTGNIELIGPDIIALQGGMFGTYVKTTGKKGKGKLTVSLVKGPSETVEFEIK